jgi:hypothetical protein
MALKVQKMMVVVVVVAGKGNIQLNVGSEAQRGAWYSQHAQSFNFISVEGRGRRHMDTFTATCWS